MILIVNPFKQKPNVVSATYPTKYDLNIKQFPFVSINGNEELKEFASSGNGTAVDPYIIEKIIFEICFDWLHDEGPCIEIQNTDEYFILRECKIIANCDNTCGIYLLNVSNTEISNNTISDLMGPHIGIGIYLTNGSNVEISNNTLFDIMGSGIFFGDSTNVTLRDNIIYNSLWGIGIVDSTFNKILNNTVYNTQEGFFLTNSFYNELKNNTANRNTVGYSLLDSNNNTLLNNKAHSNFANGIELYNSSWNRIFQNSLIDNRKGIFEDSDSVENIIENNTIEDRGIPMYYLLIPVLIIGGLGSVWVIMHYKRKKL